MENCVKRPRENGERNPWTTPENNQRKKTKTICLSKFQEVSLEHFLNLEDFWDE